MATTCAHVNEVRDVAPQTEGCAECLASGDTWVQLRMCLTCGHVGCCDSSRNKHARQHFHWTKHPLIHSYHSGQDWAWCYMDETYIQPVPSAKAA